jgi:uncharacterized repeat protein (TIGR02543 family)
MATDILDSLIRSMLLPILGCFWFASGTPADAAEPWRSVLYPENWQRPDVTNPFSSDKLIQDFSYAGYKRGEEPIPVISGPVFDVIAYGADPSGASDSTVAIQNAIHAAAAAGGGVVVLPAGEFRISPQGSNNFCLNINTSGIVLRGAGDTETFLLNTSYEMNGKAVVQVSSPSTPLGSIRNITADLAGPTRRIPVQNADSFAAGDIIRIEWSFTDEWIAEHNQQTWWNATNGRPANARYLREVTATNPVEGWIEVDVPTRYTMKTRDSANVRRITGLLAGVGVESLAIGNLQHPGTGWGENDYTDPTKAAYDTHNSWLIRLSSVRDSWVKDVQSRQATTNTSTCHMLSNGISLVNCLRITVRDCEMRRPQYGGGGGNGYMFRVQNSNECLIQSSIADFSRHGFVISHAGTSGNVFLQCEDLNTQRATGSTGSYTTSGSGSDNHMHFSHSNLWDRCHAHNSFYTASHRGFSGTVPHGLTSAHGVYWNTSGSGTRYTDIVRSAQARYGYVIGTSGTRNGATNSTAGNTAPADHLEGIGLGATLEPPSLYFDQLSRRLEPTLTYRGNGATSGTAPVDTNSPYGPGATVTVFGPGNLVKTGSLFSGWNTMPDGSGTSHAADGTFELTGSTILYAQWTMEPYTVTFDANGGSTPDPAEKVVEFGASYGTLATSNRPGFSFGGWFTAPSGGTEVTPATIVTATGNHTLFARWSAPPDVNAGPDQTVELAASGPWSPVQISAAAWYDAADTGSISEALGTVTQWDDKSGKNHHLSQAEPTRRPSTGRSLINGLNVLDFSGDYIFTSNGLGADIQSVFMVTSTNVAITSSTPAMILLSTAGGGISTGDAYGSSTGAFAGEVLSVFDENSTSFLKRQAASSSKLPVIEAGPHLYSYALATDWFIGLDGSDDLRDLTSGASRNPMRFANSFSIGAGARSHPGDVGFFYNGSVAEVILLDTPVSEAERQTIEGYLAHKWGLTENLPLEHPYQSLAPQAPATTVTLDGTVSDPENDPLTYTWSLVSGPVPVLFADATAARTTATFTEEGVYTLRLTSNDGSNSSFDECVVTVIPEVFFTVTYDGNGSTGGTPPADPASPYKSGATVPLLDAGDLSKSGHTFAAWNTTADGTGTDYAPGGTFTADDSLTLYAKWTPNTYLVSFDANGGGSAAPSSKAVTFGMSYGDLATTHRSGFTFTGWFTAAVGGYQVTGDTVVSTTEDQTLFARWNAVPDVDAGPDQTIVLGGFVPWTPAGIPMAAWYDAADPTSITASGDRVSQWNDKSGKHNHAAQTSELQRPTTGTADIGGLNAISFNPDENQFLAAPDHESLDLDATGGANVVAVLNYTGYVNRGSGLNSILSKDALLSANAAYGIRLNSTNTLSFKAAADLNINASGALSSQNVIFGGMRVDSTSTASVYINGTMVGTESTASIASDNTSSLVIGGEATTSRCADVRIGEILIIPGGLADENRLKLEGYLAHKWGLAGNLAAEHPFKATTPGTFVAVATLGGTAMDAENDPMSHAWTVVSGPAEVSFSNAAAVDTHATFTEHGVYTLRLTSGDGLGSNSDELVITVEQPPATKPAVNAWPRATVIKVGQPLSAATLSGGSASVPGSFQYADPSIIPGAGSYSAEVIFTPDDTMQYLAVAGTVDVEALTPFAHWITAGAGGEGNTAAAFTGDTNGDGVADGMAWLLTASDPAADANPLLPTAIEDSGALEVTFRTLNQAHRDGAVLKLQYATDLGTWTTVTVPEESGTQDGVDFVITPSGDHHEVKASISPGAAGTDGSLFMRLSGEWAPGTSSL